MIEGFEQVWYKCVATACTSDVAHSGPRCAQGACVYEKLEGMLAVKCVLVNDSCPWDHWSTHSKLFLDGKQVSLRTTSWMCLYMTLLFSFCLVFFCPSLFIWAASHIDSDLIQVSKNWCLHCSLSWHTKGVKRTWLEKRWPLVQHDNLSKKS